MFSKFFSSLWSSSSSKTIDQTFLALLGDLPSLDSDDMDTLSKPVTKLEVYRALPTMARGKSPRLDGLTKDFYLFYWNIIGDHLFKIVSHFSLLASILSPGVELTLFSCLRQATLIMSMILAYSLCDVSYKIISKILASHLKLVIHKLVI